MSEHPNRDTQRDEKRAAWERWNARVMTGERYITQHEAFVSGWDAAAGLIVPPGQDWRAIADMLATELRRWGMGDFHYGHQVQERRVTEALRPYNEAVAALGEGGVMEDSLRDELEKTIGGVLFSDMIVQDRVGQIASRLLARFDVRLREPSPEARQRVRDEVLNDPNLSREIEEFRDFLESRGAGRLLEGETEEPPRAGE